MKFDDYFRIDNAAWKLPSGDSSFTKMTGLVKATDGLFSPFKSITATSRPMDWAVGKSIDAFKLADSISEKKLFGAARLLGGMTTTDSLTSLSKSISALAEHYDWSPKVKGLWAESPGMLTATKFLESASFWKDMTSALSGIDGNASLNKSINAAFPKQSEWIKPLASAGLEGPRFSPIWNGGDLGQIGGIMQKSAVWESVQIGSLFQRVLTDAQLRDGLITKLRAEGLSTDIDESAEELTDADLLEHLEKALTVAGMDDSTVGFQQIIDNLGTLLQQTPPGLRKSLANILEMIIAGILVAMMLGETSKREEGATTISQVTVNQKVKIVQKAAKRELDSRTDPDIFFSSVRIVAKELLIAFETRRLDSPRVGNLAAGQVVLLEKKRRKWSKVTWRTPQSGGMQTGWVLSKYLKKI
jgi:hypothetical protein